MQQIIKMLAIIEARMDANTKTMLASMDAHQTRMDTMHEMMAKMTAWGETLDAWSTDTKDNGEETMACQETMKASLEEEKQASMELKPKVAKEEVPLEDSEFMPVGEPRKDGCRKNLVAARRAAVEWRKINVCRKILTHGYCGLRKEVTATGMKITRCAGHGRKGRNQEIVIGRNRIRRREPKNERSKSSRSRDVKELLQPRKERKTAKIIGGRSRRQQLRLETTRNSNEVLGKSIGLGFGKRAAGSLVALRKIEKWTSWGGRPHPKRKKQQH
jgi:hypothetical protein